MLTITSLTPTRPFVSLEEPDIVGVSPSMLPDQPSPGHVTSRDVACDVTWRLACPHATRLAGESQLWPWASHAHDLT